jgi:glycosyltransferase involved in cell wall biosynthesis
LGHSENIHIIFHDNLQPETIIPIDGRIKNLFGLTDWHANNIKRSFPQFKIDYNNYGVDQELFNGNIKTKNSFIYSSFPNRGLIIVLRMWPKIIKEFPDATLNIYCNLEQEWVNTNYPEMMDQIRKLLKINRTGIKVHGFVSKSELAEAWNTSEYFLYPCIFEETFCLTALEAAISQTCIISNGLAALSETAKHGITVEGNPLLPEWEIRCFEKLKHIMVSDNYKRSIVEKNYQWAQTLTWKSQTEKLMLKL